MATSPNRASSFNITLIWDGLILRTLRFLIPPSSYYWSLQVNDRIQMKVRYLNSDCTMYSAYFENLLVIE